MRIFTPILTIACLLFHFSSSAQISYVSPNGTGDGTSWNNASGDLRNILVTRSSGDEVWVAAGTYFPDLTDREASFLIPSGVEVYGGFNGTETNQTQRNPLINPTILSGAINDANDDEDNSYSVVATVNVSSTTLLDGFIIEYGIANGLGGGFDNPDRAGGGWHNLASNGNESSPSINNCIFRNNYAFGFGGGLANIADYGATCSSLITNCIFENNICDNDGGGLYNGGKVNGNCQPQIIDCVFDNNTAGNGGGAIYNNGQDGLCNPIIDRCQILNNYSDYAGGGIYSFGKDGEADAQISNSLIVGNIAQFGGGGVYNLGNGTGSASPTVVNCTFTLNSSVVGGAMYNNAGTAGGTASPNITNCIFWNNPVSASGSVFRANYGTPNISYSIVDVADCNSLNSGSGSNVNCGPGMQYNANPNLTATFEIPIGSPAINAGDNVVINSLGLLLDLNQGTRIQNALVDLGATETFSPDLDTDGDGIFDDQDNCPTIVNANQIDVDMDGFGAVCDCDDTEALVNDNATEICDGLDNNCDGLIDEGFDQDGDGFKTCEGDCDDMDSTVFPGALELCDGIDNDCNGLFDDGAQPIARYPDMDGDLLGDANAVPSFDCPPLIGYVTDNTDCDDTNPFLPQLPGTPCNDGNPNTIGDVIQADGCTCLGVPGTSGYCASLGMQPWIEWISRVGFGDIQNNSLKEQYGDFTGLSTTVSIGNSFPIEVQASFSYPHFDEYIRIWIDFNQDSDFEDDGELVLEAIHPTGPDGSLPPLLSGDLTIPTTATLGNTRMRISMKRDAYADPCESFDFGEVEDYSINIINNGPLLTLTCPADQTLTTDIGATTVSATWDIPTPTTTCPNGNTSISQTAGLAPGDDFPIGVNTVTYEATDDCGNIETCSFDIIVNDGGPAMLMLSCPADQTLTTDIGATTVSATWDIPTPTTTCPNGNTSISQTAGLAPGDDFPIGVNTVTYEATDDCGNIETCSFDIIVNDGGPAVLTIVNCPNDQTLTTAIGQTTAIATWSFPTANTTCPNSLATIIQTEGLPSGDPFPIGINTVTYEATDDCGNIETCSFDIIVNDGGPAMLTLSCPADQTLTTDIGATTVSATWDIPTPTTTCPNGNTSISQTAGLAPGDDFPIGVNTVTYEATDDCGNIETCSFDIIVNDGGPAMLTLSCPADQTLTTDIGATTVSATWDIPTPTTTCPNGNTSISQTAGLAPGDDFPIGVNTVTYEATDDCGNIETCSFDIIVNDGGPAMLTLSCPADQTLTTDIGQTTVIATWSFPTANTTCPNSLATIIQTGGLPSGDPFPIGINTVTYEATDICGNTEICSFDIIVNDGGPIGNGYCTSSATQPWEEWIGNVSLSDLNNTSTKSGYSDFTNLTANVNTGENYQLSVQPTFSYTHFTEYIQVWIDFNQNENFNDPGELVLSQVYENGVNGTLAIPVSENIMIPSSASSGNTRMRVSMQRDQASSSCEDFDRGEVEDYTINVTASGPILTLSCSNDFTINAGVAATSGILTWNEPTLSTTCPSGNTNILQTSGPTNGSTQPIGTYSISYEATDDCGNIENCSFDITIESQPATLTLNCPTDQVISTLPGASTAIATWTIPTPNSDCPTGSTLINQTTGLAPGESFPIGINTITYEATDDCGNIEICFFTITINDGGITTLSLDCPVDQTLTTIPGENTITTTWSTPVPVTNCPSGVTNILQTAGLSSGSSFPIGVNTISYEATDDCGNIETCSFTVTVNDGGPVGNGYCESSASAPWVEWIGNVSLNDLDNTSNKSGYSDFTNLVANVDLGGNYQIGIQPVFSYTHFTEYIQVWIDFNQNESFADPGELIVSAIYSNGINGTVASPIIQNINIPSGALTGNTRMRVSMNRTEAADPCDLFEFGEVEDYTVNIINSGPVLTLNCSGDLNISAGVGTTSGIIAWDIPTATSTCPTGTPTLIQTSGPANGSTQPLGIYTIAYESTDDCGNIENCSFTISLTSDPTSLSISCPANQVLTTAAGSTTAIANWNIPTPITTCPGGLITLEQIEGLPIGSDFPIGINTITYEAIDDCGNIENCSFTITVNDGGPSGNGYCESVASAPWEEWIGNVSLSDLNNTSGKNGYGDFTALTANVIKGESYSLSIQPIFSYTHFTEHFQVWIDFNGNENFNDPGELVVSTVYDNGINGSIAPPIIEDITIPNNAPTGNTRMRVTMSRNAAVGPCENFGAGEVEDYTINIGNAPVNAIVNSETMFNLSAQVEARTVRLNWVSSLDETTSAYTIERKGLDDEFREIDQNLSFDNSQQTHYYQYIDRSVTHGNYEYRVTAIKHDGSKVFTNIQTVDLGSATDRLVAFPNPANAQVTFVSHLLADHSVNLMLTNSLGQVIHQKQYDSTTDQRIILDLSDFPNGIYLVRFQAGKRKAMHTRLVVERD